MADTNADDLTRRAIIERVQSVIDDLDASHCRAVSPDAITDDYQRGRVHAEDDLWRRLVAALALDGTEATGG